LCYCQIVVFHQQNWLPEIVELLTPTGLRPLGWKLHSGEMAWLTSKKLSEAHSWPESAFTSFVHALSTLATSEKFGIVVSEWTLREATKKWVKNFRFH
jgi:hypothetical protein